MEIKACAWCRHVDTMEGDRPAYWMCNKSRSNDVDLVSGKRSVSRKLCSECRASTSKVACGREGKWWEEGRQSYSGPSGYTN